MAVKPTATPKGTKAVQQRATPKSAKAKATPTSVTKAPALKAPTPKASTSKAPTPKASKAKSFDPLSIGTISDTESVADMDEDSETEKLAATAAKKKAKKNPDTAMMPVKAAELNTDFTFELSGGDLDAYSRTTASYWDFKAAKAAVKGASKGLGSNEDDAAPSNTIEDMIERKRKELKERKRAALVKKAEVVVEEEEEPEIQDMGDVMMDANGNFVFDNASDAGSEDEELDLMADEMATDEPTAADDEMDQDEEEDDDEKYAAGLDAMDEDSADELSGEEDQVTVAPKRQPMSDDDDSDASDDETNEIQDIVNEKRKAEFFAPTPEAQDPTEESTETFQNFRLSRPILKAVADMGYNKPTPIQSRAIPLSLQAHDLCVSAQTGSGKTLAFLVPIIERLLFRPKDTPTTRVLVLVPTRELGVQCHSVATKLSKFTDISWSLCVGGLSTKVQELELRQRPDGVIATPGRLIDHIRNSQGFTLDGIEILVIDEADRILEDGFADELDEIIKSTPKTRQSMLFSATMTDKIDDLTKLSLNRPIRLFVNKATALTSRLTQEFVRVRAHKENSKPAMLLALCSRTYKEEVVIFFRSKAAAHYMKVLFGLCGLNAAELHGNLTQLQRLESLESFRDQKSNYLLCTDLASRGLDIPGVKTVINYDMPKSYSTYVHRCGRTARAGQSGLAVSFVGESDRAVLKMAMKASTDEIQHRVIPGKVVTRYEVKVEEMKGATAEVLVEEKKEKEMKGMEMKVKKMENMMEFAEDIANRPKKSWFQTTAEKTASKQLGKDKHNIDMGAKVAVVEDTRAPIKRGKFDGLSRHARRMRMAKEEDKKEMAMASVAARSAKKAARPTRISSVPESTGKPSGVKGGGPTKKKSLFESEATGIRGKKKSGGAAAPVASAGGSKMGAKSGGVGKKKTSNHKFKSLQKHKRR
ncbi:nucleolar DEAD-box protein required for synthesis of 60S ribosomal subunit [Podochytrium sp. JEL0797]|nr:nucleolar DEAD-box protein required for synthesis of 60S ribosomal subunit [Podochytrium sp. JEL0797]